MQKRFFTGAAAVLLCFGLLTACGESQTQSTPDITVTVTATAKVTTVTEQTTTDAELTTTQESLTDAAAETATTAAPAEKTYSQAELDKQYRTGYDAGYAEGLADGEKRQLAASDAQKISVWVSGDFTATVRSLIPDYVSDGQNRAAVVTLFQDVPFVLRLSPELCTKLKAGETYTFTVGAQEAALYPGQFQDESTVNPEALVQDSFRVSDVRTPEEDEYGLGCWRVHYTT